MLERSRGTRTRCARSEKKTVKVGSDHSENLTHVYDDAMKGKLIYSSVIFIEKVGFED